MTFAQSILVYVVSWWMLLFMALPIGVHVQENPEPGLAPSAPQKPYLGRKCAIVTVLALLATWAIDFVIGSGIVAVK